MKTTTHTVTRADGTTKMHTFTGAHLFDVVARTTDGQSARAIVAADDEWKARSRLMLIQTTMKLSGQFVSYDIVIPQPLVELPADEFHDRWIQDLAAAVAERDGETLARMMADNDPNGCYSFDDCVRERIATTRDEWIDVCIQTAFETYLCGE